MILLFIRYWKFEFFFSKEIEAGRMCYNIVEVVSRFFSCRYFRINLHYF